MNKVILMGRLTRDPEVRYSNAAEPMAIARYTLAVNRRFKREGEQDADFINCTCFGKAAEFAERYFRKGMQVLVSGRLQIRDYEENGQRKWFTEVLLDEQNFTESKAANEAIRQGGGGQQSQPYPQSQGQFAPPAQNQPPAQAGDSFFAIDQDLDDDDLPF